MIYSNVEFFILAAVAICAYQLAKNSYEARFNILLIASWIFYAWAGIFDTVIFIFVVAISWLSIWFAARFPRQRKAALVGGICLMTLHLFFWKYGPSFVEWIHQIFPKFNSGQPLNVPLPVGISFFTLQGIAYLIDFYKREADYMPLKRYLLFKSFFPQLVAGPIVRVPQLLPQLEVLKMPSSLQVTEGISLFVLGFAKKVAIADRMAPFVNPVFSDPLKYDRESLILAVVAYTVQIWGDFSGYTDMGRGVAKVFGVHLPENFLSPYLSLKPSEFWRRWHVTLSLWIRDYIYIPLGGGKGSFLRVVCVAILTMVISGLWHGAGITFILWGLYHGTLLALERIVYRWKFLQRLVGCVPDGFKKFLLAALMLWLIMFGWLIFRSQSILLLRQYIDGLFHPIGTNSLVNTYEILIAFVLCLLIQGVSYQKFDLSSFQLLPRIRLSITNMWKSLSVSPIYSDIIIGFILAFVFVLSVLLRPGEYSSQFIYFQF